jgi:hypothetical protein
MEQTDHIQPTRPSAPNVAVVKLTGVSKEKNLARGTDQEGETVA